MTDNKDVKKLAPLLIIIFVLHLPIKAWGISCQELQRDMIAVDALISRSTPQKCDKKNTTFCCNSEVDPNSCRTNYDARERYNKALAKLTIIEGLIALGQSIEGSHHSLRNIDANEIDQALKDMSTFAQTFDRAKLIDLSMETTTGAPRSESGQGSQQRVGDRSIWDDYRGEKVEDLQKHLSSVCQSNQKASKANKQKSISNFCKEYKRQTDELARSGQEDAKTKLLETLQGFAVASSTVLSSNRNTNYKNYREYLHVEIGGNTPVAISDLSFNKNFHSVVELRKLLNQYRKELPSPSPKLIRQIVSKSKELDELHISFQKNETLPDRLMSFSSDYLEKSLASIRSASGTFLNINHTIDNIGIAKKTLDIDLTSSRASAMSDAEAFITDSMKDFCQDNESPVECIERACSASRSKANNACVQTDANSSFIASGLREIHAQIANLQEAEGISDALDKMNKCMNQQISGARKCLQDEARRLNSSLNLNLNVDDLPSALAKARAELAQAQEIINFNASSVNINQLEQLKAMALVQIQENRCHSRRKYTLGMTSACNLPEVIGHSRDFVEFQENLGDALVSYNREMMQDIYRDQQKTTNYFAQRDKMIEVCQSNPDPSYASLCSHLMQQKELETYKQPTLVDEAIARHFVPSPARTEFDTSLRTASIVGGLGTVAVMGVTEGLTAAIQRQQTEAYLDQWRWQSERNAYWNEYNRNQMYNYNPNMNWGINYWNPYYSSSFQYPDNNQIYYQQAHHDLGQFTFPPSMTMNPMSGPSPAGNYNFNFQ